ncbi:probable DNA metabolism protein [bacterium A37T11]|nr:probable DNA metabolism protein [bacterium A37T11]
MYYVFDGSYAGFMSCVFESFERKEPGAIPVTELDFQPGLFQEGRTVQTDLAKMERVLRGLRKQLGDQKVLDFFRAFLSEDRKVWLSSFHIIHQIFQAGPAVLTNYGDADVLYFSQTLHKVSRERHRMKAFTRFQKSADGLFFAIIEPDFNVLPLVSGFFKNRYADQRWLIYDVKRRYGLLHEEGYVSEVQLTAPEKDALTDKAATITLDERDAQFELLWKQYFKSTNIESRRNMKLHLQHVPRRYWKYLPEKQG